MLPWQRARPSLPFKYSHRHLFRLCLFTPIFLACTGLLGMVVVQGRFEVLQRSSFWSVAVTELFLLFALRHILRTQTRLTIDSKGIDFRFGQSASTFRWDDIDGVRSIVADPRRNVRVVEIFAKGQHESASAEPSLIYCKTIGADDLVRLINEGRQRWGAA